MTDRCRPETHRNRPRRSVAAVWRALGGNLPGGHQRVRESVPAGRNGGAVSPEPWQGGSVGADKAGADCGIRAEQWNLFVQGDGWPGGRQVRGVRAGGYCRSKSITATPVSPGMQLRAGRRCAYPGQSLTTRTDRGGCALFVRCHYKTRAPRQVADWMDLLDEWYPPGAPPD